MQQKKLEVKGAFIPFQLKTVYKKRIKSERDSYYLMFLAFIDFIMIKYRLRNLKANLKII